MRKKRPYDLIKDDLFSFFSPPRMLFNLVSKKICSWFYMSATPKCSSFLTTSKFITFLISGGILSSLSFSVCLSLSPMLAHVDKSSWMHNFSRLVSNTRVSAAFYKIRIQCTVEICYSFILIESFKITFSVDHRHPIYENEV